MNVHFMYVHFRFSYSSLLYRLIADIFITLSNSSTLDCIIGFIKLEVELELELEFKLEFKLLVENVESLIENSDPGLRNVTASL